MRSRKYSPLYRAANVKKITIALKRQKADAISGSAYQAPFD